MCEAIEDFEEVEKLGQGFSSADPLEEIDIGDWITPRPTFVNKNMSSTQVTQVTDGKENIITYLSQCLIDVETRYSFNEKLYLSLFYACSKLRHYMLSSTCVVACQTDVIKHMLQ
jgi:hypothetical protein